MKYFGGCDVGSTYTKCVIVNEKGEMVSDVTIRSRINSEISAKEALDQAVAKVDGLSSIGDLTYLIGTGYGRNKVPQAQENISEISCHAMGVHVVDPTVKAIIDIGGQDVKGIAIDQDGTVLNFAMNDKCAAGTGRFLEMMARTMEMSLDEMSHKGLKYKEDITISSMCTVFAESEVVSLIAQNKDTDDIVHGLNKAVASKTAALAKRVGGEERYMMTGGVSKNESLVKTLEEKLGTTLVVDERAQLCGALGAALFAMDMVEKD